MLGCDYIYKIAEVIFLIETFLIIIPIFLLMGVLFYLLYIGGIMTVQQKQAAKFIGATSRRNNSCEAMFSCCDGYIKKVIRFKENREYQFCLKSDISKGEVTVEIQNKSKEVILLLTQNNPEDSLVIDKSQRYYLVFCFQNASGEYEFNYK